MNFPRLDSIFLFTQVETIDWVEPGTLTFIYSSEINVKGVDGFAVSGSGFFYFIIRTIKF